METLVEEHVLIRQPRPIGVVIPISSGNPPTGMTPFEDDDDDDGDYHSGSKPFLIIKILVVFVICLSALVLVVRRLIVADHAWLDTLQTEAVIWISSYRPFG